MFSASGSLSVTAPPVETPPAVRLIQMVQGYQVTQIVGAVARLGLADLLAAGSKSSTDLTGATGADPDGLLRLLRAAATVGLITEAEVDRFALTPVGACLATDAQPASLRDFAMIMAGPGHWLPYGLLLEAVMTGRCPAKTALGMELWDYYREYPEEGATFAGTVENASASVAPEIAACYNLTRFTRIVDIGGNQGALLAGLLAAAPLATGVLFEQPEVIDQARSAITARGLAERVEFIGGDPFTEVPPPGGDLYVLKSILHWDDEHALRVLANCHRAAEPGSRLLVIESVVPTGSEPSPLHLIDLSVLVQVGGQERTHEQHQALLEAAGYRLERIIPPPPGTYSWLSLLEARRC
jgi:SAM-dependent methyltransferase